MNIMNIMMLLIFYMISALSQLQCSYSLNNRTELRYFIISFVLFAPGLYVTCQFLFSQTLNILFEIALLFRITVKQTAINVMCDDSHDNILDKVFDAIFQLPY